jgi:hypothetical protein
MSSDPNPFELVTALRSPGSEARAVLRAWCQESIRRLVAAVASRLATGGADVETLTTRALRWLELYLRARDPAAYQGLGRDTFVLSLLLAAYRCLDPVERHRQEALSLGGSEPECDTYKIRSYSRPLEQSGGDWWDHDAERGRMLWVIIGDVTGHGYPAYLLAAGLPHLWRAKPIAELRARMQEPRDVLAALGRELEEVLPDDLFVEAALGRFDPFGAVVLAAAGGSRPILRRSRANQAEVLSLSGGFLGLELGERDQCSWTLYDGDELVLATDGLFDQPCGDSERLGTRLAECCAQQLCSGRDLHAAVLEVLGQALVQNAQQDDITVITLLRHRGFSLASSSSDAGM